MIKTRTTISNKLGLRPRLRQTHQAGGQFCDVFMSRGDRRINAKSIMGVMMLAAGMGTEVEVETSGEREQEAMDALLALIADKFGEGSDPRPGPPAPQGAEHRRPLNDFSIHGLAVARALPLAAPCWWRPAGWMAHYFIQPEQVAAEIERVRQGRNTVVDELQRLQADMPPTPCTSWARCWMCT